MVGLDPANAALTVSGLVTQKKIKKKKSSTKSFLNISCLTKNILFLITLSVHSRLSFFLALIDRVSPAYTPYQHWLVIDKELHRL